MAIHHAQIKSAESMGYTLEEQGDVVRAFMPSTGQQVFGVSAKDAMNQMIAFQNILKRDDQIRAMYIEGTPKTHVKLRHLETGLRSTTVTTPVEHYRNFNELEWEGENVEQVFSPETVDKIEDTFVEDEHPKDPPVDASPVIKRSPNGVALDGAVAYREGVTAADCPYSSEEPEDGSESEYDDFVRWNEEWDAAADEATDEEEESKGGSVVASRYRTKYAEAGHPTHCGDWLAELLNNYCIGDKNTDLEIFENICDMNGVDTSKYKREGVGWQGRIRMTGRNLLAKVVFKAGKITVPVVDGPGTQEITAPADWLSAQRYNKPKGE